MPSSFLDPTTFFLSEKLGEDHALRTEAGDYDTAARVLKEIDFDYLLLWGHARLVVELHEQLYEHLRDEWLQMACSNSLALAYADLGQVRRAITYYERGLEIARKREDKRGEGAFLGNLGNAYYSLGQVERAIEFFQQALDIDREIGYRRGEGADLTGLGNAYYSLGQVERAIEFFQQALTIDREIGYRRGEGADLGNLGIAYYSLGQVERAIEFYQQALTIAREIGDRRGEGNRLTGLGIAYADLGQVERAIEYYQQALTIAREIGDRSGESIDLDTSALALLLKGENAQAIEHAEDAIRIADDIGFVQTQHYGRVTLALAQLQAGDLSAARAAVEAARQYDRPDNNHAAAALHGVIALRQGEAEAARQAFREALALADELLGKTPQFYDAHYTRGLAWSGLALCGEDAAEAVAHAAQAYRDARAITAAAGIVQEELLKLDALAVADEAGVLGAVRRVLAGGA